MPQQAVSQDGKTFYLREYDPPALEPDHLRIQVRFASPKHGTELHLLGGSALQRKRWDPELRLLLPSEEAPPDPGERPVGNIVVGQVMETGPAVTRFQPGDQVFAYGPIRELHTTPENRVYPLGSLTNADAVCTDPAHVAFVAIRDGNLRIGDDVAIYGLGAIGLLALQIARASGAHRVFGVDPIAKRREQALAYGATAAFDPRAVDAALQIKLATDRQGVDVALETSGSGPALHDSIRCLRQCGTLVHVPWGPKDASALHLDEEFHLNRPTIIGSQAVWQNPDRDHPLWNEARAREAATRLLQEGRITGEGIVTPIIRFQECASELGPLMQDPTHAIKVGIEF
jgi:threonine dehydrogenase-like Zn-dependent dehydrogenase